MHRRVSTPLWLALACVALFVALASAAHEWAWLVSLDLAGFTGFLSARSSWIESASWRLVDLGDPREVALITLALAALAMARGRPRVALAVLVLVAATSVSSQVIQALNVPWAYPREVPALDRTIDAEAYPSGHATAAMTLALAAVLVSPRAARPAAAVLGALLALAVGVSTIVIEWHFPSDVLGGYLLATAWTSLVVAGLRTTESRLGAGERWTATRMARATQAIAARGLPLLAGAGLLAVLLGGLALAASDPGAVAGFAAAHTTAVATAAVLVAAAVALPTAVTVVIGRPDA